jgi:uncharacterized protein YjbJ (UPF0337 family)
MKKSLLFIKICFIFTLFISSALAEETLLEKAESVGNATARTVRKGANRVSEAVCNKGKAECAGEKIKNRAQEAKDAVVDSAKELKNKID